MKNKVILVFGLVAIAAAAVGIPGWRGSKLWAADVRVDGVLYVDGGTTAQQFTATQWDGGDAYTAVGGGVTAPFGTVGTCVLATTSATCGAFTANNFLVSSGIIYPRGNKILDDNNSALTIEGGVTNGGAAVALIFDTTNALTTTAKIASYRTAGVSKVDIERSGKAIYPTGTADAVVGRVALIGGTTTIATAAVTANSVISVTNCLNGGTPGLLSIGTIVAGTSFVVNSASGTDTSTICWMLQGN